MLRSRTLFQKPLHQCVESSRPQLAGVCLGFSPFAEEPVDVDRVFIPVRLVAAIGQEDHVGDIVGQVLDVFGIGLVEKIARRRFARKFRAAVAELFFLDIVRVVARL